MTNPSAQTMLEPCPFCHDQPSFSDVELKDERRYAEKLLRCCSVEMSATLSFSQYKGLTDAQIDHALRSELVKNWNMRPASAPAAVREDLSSIALKIAEKISQLRHYRDNDCQLDHARAVADGRISQAEMDLRWVNEILRALPEEASTEAGEAVAYRWRYRIKKNEGWSRWIPQDSETIIEFRKIQSHNLADGLCEVQPLYAAPPAAQTDGLEEIIADLRRDKLRLIEALEFICDGYDNHDVNHVDYRVKVYQVALDALAAAGPSPQVTEAVRHDG